MSNCAIKMRINIFTPAIIMFNIVKQFRKRLDLGEISYSDMNFRMKGVPL
jgi:hypothetical protein